MYGSLMAVTVIVGSCDAHRDLPDMGMKIGDILCTDGSVMGYERYEESEKEAIAVVFHIDSDEGNGGDGYAVYLKDIRPEMFADSIGVAQKTSVDLTALDGNENTFAMFSASGIGSPLANSVLDLWRYGQSAYIPSAAQMRLLYTAKEHINPIMERCGGERLPDDADGCWYWTSTEVEGQEAAKAWLYSMGSGALQETPKDQAHRARPIITIYR